MGPIVIVGSGLAGCTVARELRKIGAQSPLVIVSRDDASLCSKPMLSNALATRILELRPGEKPGDAATVVDFRGSYEDYLARAGAELAAA